jgi:hypothetical protein
MFHKCAISAALFAVVAVWVSERGQFRAPLLDTAEVCWTETSESAEEDRFHFDDSGTLGSSFSIGLASFQREVTDAATRIWRWTPDGTLPVRGPPID